MAKNDLMHGNTSLLVLSLIEQRDMYGYQIIKELKRKSENVFELKEGSLYPVLHALENEKLITSYIEETESARKRRYYKITDKGRKELADKKEEFFIFTNAARKVLNFAWGGIMKSYEIFTKEKILYLYKATEPIKYKRLQDRIYFELSNHIDDMFCDFIDDGMSENDATEKFLNEMGNPEELSEELKKAHKDTLHLVKFLKGTAVMTALVLIISIFGVFEAKDNLDLAKHYNLPQETVELEKNLATYTKLEYWSFPIDIYFYTDIDWHNIHTTKPTYKVKENNLFKDYYILDESQSVLVDTFRAAGGLDGVFYVDDAKKIPRNYHSDKISKVVLSNYETNLSFTINLTPKEIIELEKLAILDELGEPLEIENLVSYSENDPYYWCFEFHIKDLEGLYYDSRFNLFKSVNGKYYIGNWLYGGKYGVMYVEIPEHLARKIDISIENAGIEFEDGELYLKSRFD